MNLKSLEIAGFKSFDKNNIFKFDSTITAIVGPNGSGKSNVAEAFRFVLGEQSFKNLRGKKGSDLIFNGGRSGTPSRRAHVKIIFSNTGRIFDLDFNEVTIERTVFYDGENEYKINNSKVRLRDVLELLASANIGAQGHRIISQGEADALLRTNPQQLRTTIEDGLGLRLYQYRKEETEKKIAKTKEKLKELHILQREMAPHITFLKKQVDRIEKVATLQKGLEDKYKIYLKYESLYIQSQKIVLKKELQDITKHQKEYVDEGNNENNYDAEKEQLEKTLQAQNHTLEEYRNNKGILEQEIGRLEGEKNILVDLHQDTSVTLKDKEVTHIQEGIQEIKQSLDNYTLLKEKIKLFTSMLTTLVTKKSGDTSRYKTLDAQYTEKQKEIMLIQHNIKEQEKVVQDTHTAIMSMRESKIAQENNKKYYEDKKMFYQNMEKIYQERVLKLQHEEELFNNEIEEAKVLLYTSVAYKDYVLDVTDDKAGLESREKQYTRQRELERIKVRIEELGSGHKAHDDVSHEYDELVTKKETIDKEIKDIEATITQLQIALKELEKHLRETFKKGIIDINKHFSEFFKILFNGGSASLKLYKPKPKIQTITDASGNEIEIKQEEVEGLEVDISIPHKQIKALHTLSGGERTLTSIALLFAMSQVTPPPFLILDETDAALDEANSQRYAHMLENLAKKSQLILITHNRNTMISAQRLYGVSMGGDGVSKLLSIQLEDVN